MMLVCGQEMQLVLASQSEPALPSLLSMNEALITWLMYHLWIKDLSKQKQKQNNLEAFENSLYQGVPVWDWNYLHCKLFKVTSAKNKSRESAPEILENGPEDATWKETWPRRSLGHWLWCGHKVPGATNCKMKVASGNLWFLPRRQTRNVCRVMIC